MSGRVAGSFERARAQVADDLGTDPYLAPILLLSGILASFWIWHRLPNFATRDERWRVVDPMEAVGFVVADPDLASLREGIAFWRSYGAAFYLYGITAIPVFVVVFATGHPDVFVEIAHHQPRGYWHYWNRVPSWIWTATVLLARAINVSLAVGCVYLLYRIATRIQDRRAGRVAALLLSLTWGLLVLAHEAGEDVPALFFLLLVVYFAFRYVETGLVGYLYSGCVAGGIAIAFKLTAGVSVVFLGAAHLLRVRREGASWRAIVRRRRPLLIGAAIGAGTVLVGYPVILVGAPEEFAARLWYGVVNKSTPHYWVVAPSWWWILRGYLHGLGMPLFGGTIVGVLASLPSVRDRSVSDDGLLLALIGIATYLLAFAPWSYVRMHHVLPTFPLLILVLSVGVARRWDRSPALARLAVIGLVVTSGTYAGIGDLGYANQPRDGASAWLASHAPENATVETYINDPQDAAIPHGMSVYHPADRTMTVDGKPREPGVVKWTLAMPERCPAYIQLNYQGGIRYLAPDGYGDRFKLPSNPRLRAYYRHLLEEDRYPYTVVAEFGPRPRFLRSQDARSRLGELLHVGLVPRSIQYGDPQDFGVNQYTVILKRTGACRPSERSPFSARAVPSTDE